jgi:hypothetical protein
MEEENKQLKQEIQLLRIQLSKYTNHPSKKKYYEEHKEAILQRQKIKYQTKKILEQQKNEEMIYEKKKLEYEKSKKNKQDRSFHM